MSSLSNPIISYCLQLVKPEAWSLMLDAWALRPRAHTRPTVKLFTTRIRIRRPATNSLTPDPTGNDFPPVHWLLDQGSRAQVCVGEDFHCIQTCPNTIPSTRDHDLCYRVYFLTPSAFDLFADHRILSGVAPARVMTLPTSELKGLFTSPNSI